MINWAKRLLDSENFIPACLLGLFGSFGIMILMAILQTIGLIK